MLPRLDGRQFLRTSSLDSVVRRSDVRRRGETHRLSLAGRSIFGRDRSAEVTGSVGIDVDTMGNPRCRCGPMTRPRGVSFERGTTGQGAGPGRTGLSGARNHSEGRTREPSARSLLS